jgi:hypothetical protein
MSAQTVQVWPFAEFLAALRLETARVPRYYKRDRSLAEAVLTNAYSGLRMFGRGSV